MKDGVATVNSSSPPKCGGSYEDIELCEKGVHSIWTVDEQGSAMEHLEDYSMEAYYAYYNCTACGETFDTERDDFGRIYYDMDDTWQQVKEHFDGNN